MNRWRGRGERKKGEGGRKEEQGVRGRLICADRLRWETRGRTTTVGREALFPRPANEDVNKLTTGGASQFFYKGRIRITMAGGGGPNNYGGGRGGLDY